MNTSTSRPAFHFAPARNWMNDPNGLIHHRGRYHLFYQHNPNGGDWGDMSWGHASSADLVTWEEHPVAIRYDENEAVFSGSIVFDAQNRSGLGTAEEPPLVAFYTSASDRGQAQAMASSRDGGLTWSKHGIVLDRGTSDFRDPKVFRHADHWIMVAVEAVERQVHLYRSDDLLEWKPLSVFESASDPRQIWECPDLFPLDGRWVLTLSVNPGNPAGGSGMQYFVGEFDGVEFTPHSWGWLDRGRDFYAGVTVEDAPERIMIGWMSNWDYAHAVPTSPWRGSAALPRTLSLRGSRLVQTPAGVPDDAAIRVYDAGRFRLDDGVIELPETAHGRALRARVRVRPGNARFEVAVRAASDGSRRTAVCYEAGVLTVDRSSSGHVDFSDKFASSSSAPLATREGVLDLDIWVDTHSVEVFADGGALVLTEQIFPDDEDTAILLGSDSDEAVIESLNVTVFA